MVRRNWILRIQPVPRNNWGDNLAHILPTPVWDHLRREVYAENSWECEICRRNNLTLNCHENWGYDDRSRIQTLESLQCLCTWCHDSIHWFRTEKQVIQGKGTKEGYPLDYLDTLKIHFCKVNRCSSSSFEYYIRRMFRVRDHRTRYDYYLVYGRYEPSRILADYEKLRSI